MSQGEAGAGSAVDHSESYIEQGVTPEVADTAEPEKAPEATKQAEESQESQDDGSEEAKKPRRGGFQRKIDRLEAENAALQARLVSDLPKSESAPAAKPQPNDYQTHDEYTEALIEYKAEQVAEKKLKARDDEARAAAFQTERQERIDSYQQQQVELRKATPDYDEALAEFDDVPVHPGITAALLDSDMGAQVAYYLAKHPEELDAINTQNTSALTINRAIGRIEARIESGKQPAKAAVRTTKSPPPFVPVRPVSTSTGNTDPRGYVEL